MHWQIHLGIMPQASLSNQPSRPNCRSCRGGPTALDQQSNKRVADLTECNPHARPDTRRWFLDCFWNSTKLPILQGEAPFARSAELQTSGRSHGVQPPRGPCKSRSKTRHSSLVSGPNSWYLQSHIQISYKNMSKAHCRLEPRQVKDLKKQQSRHIFLVERK